MRREYVRGDDSLDGKIALGENPASETVTAAKTPPVEATHTQKDNHDEGNETGQVDALDENNNNINESTDGSVEVTKEPADKANVEVEDAKKKHLRVVFLESIWILTTMIQLQKNLYNRIWILTQSTSKMRVHQNGIFEEQPPSNVGVVLEASTEKENSEPTNRTG